VEDDEEVVVIVIGLGQLFDINNVFDRGWVKPKTLAKRIKLDSVFSGNVQPDQQTCVQMLVQLVRFDRTKRGIRRRTGK
jgi:hypothetical protein